VIGHPARDARAFRAPEMRI